MTVWHEVEDALEAIIQDYTRVNHLISLFQDDKARLAGLRKTGHQTGTALELGSGPGNFTNMLKPRVDGQIVCLDYSDKMIAHAKKDQNGNRVHHIRGGKRVPGTFEGKIAGIAIDVGGEPRGIEG